MKKRLLIMFLCLESFGLVAPGGGGGEKSLAIQKIAPKTMFSEDYQIELGLARNPYRQEGLWLRNAFEPFASQPWHCICRAQENHLGQEVDRGDQTS